MMILLLLTWNLGIAGLPKPRIESRRAGIYKISQGKSTDGSESIEDICKQG
jgi:hypothetical protein